MLKPFNKWPAWPRLLITCLLVAVLGYIDCLPGGFPVLILYVIPILLVAWSQGWWWGIFISLASGLTHFVSDYYGHARSTFRSHDYYLDIVFLLVTGILITLLGKMWDEELSYTQKADVSCLK